MEEQTEKYRAVFISKMGMEVLGDILRECHFGCTIDPDNKVAVAEYNVGIVILAKCGILGQETLEDVIRALCNVAPRQEEEVKFE